MKTWLVGCAVAMLAGLGAFLAAKKPAAPPPSDDVPAPPIHVAAAVPPPPVPAMLDRVVETADIDSLLDPPAIPTSEPRTTAGPMIILVGFDEPPFPAGSSPFAEPIPKSNAD